MAMEQPSLSSLGYDPPAVPRGRSRGRILWSRALSPIPNGCDRHDNADFSLCHLLRLRATGCRLMDWCGHW